MFDLNSSLTLDLRVKEVSNKITAALWKAAVQTAVDIENDAKAAAPVRSGKLKDSIQVTVEKAEGFAAIEASTNCGYGAFVELGTARMRAQPFLGPAVRKNSLKLAERVRDEIGS